MSNFRLNSKQEINVYIYEGLERDKATKSLIPNNLMPEVGKIYSVSSNSGILVVAWPNKNKQTKIEFEYWISKKVTANEVAKPKQYKN